MLAALHCNKIFNCTGNAGVIKEGENPKELSLDDWKKRLNEEQFYVCRQKGTEPVSFVMI